MKHNPRELNRRIVLLRPSAPVRDELGGIAPTTYTAELSLFAKITSRNQSRQQVVGDYVTVDTRYFVLRDVRRICPDLNVNWRVGYRNFVFIINDIQLLDEENPPYTQITATAVNGSGCIVKKPEPEPEPDPPAQGQQEQSESEPGNPEQEQQEQEDESDVV